MFSKLVYEKQLISLFRLAVPSSVRSRQHIRTHFPYVSPSISEHRSSGARAGSGEDDQQVPERGGGRREGAVQRGVQSAAARSEPAGHSQEHPRRPASLLQVWQVHTTALRLNWLEGLAELTGSFTVSVQVITTEETHSGDSQGLCARSSGPGPVESGRRDRTGSEV